MPILLPEDRNIRFPKMMKIRQKFDTYKVENVKQSVTDILKRKEIESLIYPGQKIAVAVGSRKIDRIAEVVAQLISELIKRGAEPFIVPAMGSHGGGRAEGCLQILKDFGITEESMGVPIRAEMDVIKLGVTKGGIEVYTDKNSYEADMTILVNRIKPHTEFSGDYESGLCKLSTIGLGRHVGCTKLHDGGTKSFSVIIPEAAQVVFREGNIGFAVGIVENAYDRIKLIEGMTKDEILLREPELLKTAKGSMPSIGIKDIDVLIVEELGKDISGIGMDPNIIGRFGPKANDPMVPKIGKIIVLRLSRQTHGNACGIGLADLTTREVYDSIDFESTYANCIACGCDYETEYIPLVMSDEQEALAAAIKMLKLQDPEKCRVVKIKNTLSLSEMEVSANLLAEITAQPMRFEIIS